MNSQLRQLCRELGRPDACWYLCAAVLRRLSGGRLNLYRYRFVAQPLAAVPAAGPRGAALAVRPLAPPLRADALGRPQAVLDARVRQGARCLGAYAGGELAGYLWYCAGAYQEDEVRARYFTPPRAVWDFDVHVFPRHRLGVTFPCLWHEAARRLQRSGASWSLSRISAFNAASRRAHARLGALDIGSAVFVRGRRWQWMVASLPPYVHFSRADAAFPRLRFRLPSGAPP
ncbi:MAG: hypothetical protein ACXU8N_01265 [Telluria sp.]